MTYILSHINRNDIKNVINRFAPTFKRLYKNVAYLELSTTNCTGQAYAAVKTETGRRHLKADIPRVQFDQYRLSA